MSPFYTRKGDGGLTGVLGDGRVAKSDLLMDAIGSVDEANSALGLARATCQQPEACEVILAIQRELYRLMAETAATPENAERFHSIDAARVVWLEEKTAYFESRVEMPREFIVPGDTVCGAALDMARTTVRRAERRMAGLVNEGRVANGELLRYLNRLSSLCFVLEIYEHQYGENQPLTRAKAGGKA